MGDRERALATRRPVWGLIAVGGLFVAFGAVQAGFLLIGGATPGEAVIDFGLIGGPGLVLLYGAYRLPHTSIDPAVYPRVVLWSLGAMAVMVGVVGLLTFNPGSSVDRPLRAVAIAGGLGAVGGFLIGTNEARAITRAQEAEQRNRELERTQAELRDAVDSLEASNERLRQFAYAASHDLQEPLRMVSSYLQLIEHRYADDLDEDGREFIEFAVDGADRTREMIHGLLQYSRVDTRGVSFDPIDLDAVFDDVLDDLQVKTEEHDAEITAEPLPRVRGDGNHLRQVFQNLVDNAIEYSGDEPPRIHVAAERAGDEWVISVSDEGIGIDPDDQDRIFQVFQHLHGGEDHHGTGIGLALCERIVEGHGGDIWVESGPGDGSTFHFTLPPADTDRELRAAPENESRA